MQRLIEMTNRRIAGVRRRKGSIIVLAAVLMTILLGFAAFAIDIGYMSMTRSQLQNAADSAALAGAMKLIGGLGPNLISTTVVASNARQEAFDLAAQNAAGDVSQVYLDVYRDVELGRRQWNSGSQSWSENWGQSPYDLVRVTARRNRAGSSNGDRTLPLFFAGILGSQTASLQATATATIPPGSGFRIPLNSLSNVPILPIAMDEPSWNALMAGNGDDKYTYGPDSGKVSLGSDGIKEINLYPSESPDLPSGNRGTVNLGSANNGTADLSRQIRYGLTACDMSYYSDSTLTTDNGPLVFNGNPGISAGMNNDLIAAIGQPRAIPLFTSVVNPGGTATYTVVRFVGVRIVHVQLGGNNKQVMIQPATLISDTVVPGTGMGSTTFVYALVRLIH